MAITTRNAGRPATPNSPSKSSSPGRKPRSPSKPRSPGKARSPARSPGRKPAAAASPKGSARKTTTSTTNGTGKNYDDTTNWTAGGVEGNPGFLAFIFLAPFLCQWLALITSPDGPAVPHLSAMLPACMADPKACAQGLAQAAVAVGPTWAAAKFLLSFNFVALVLERVLPGSIEVGPETHTGHIPAYVDNGLLHCVLYSALFVGGSNLGLGWYDFGIMFDVFAPAVTILNVFGLLFSVFLYFKGLHFPSTKDSGSSGSLLIDYVWGTELYPRIMGVDIKRFINCRFSMTFWQLAGLSFAYRSYTIHGTWDYGLALAALSQYMYLVKFFQWEIGYMRSIDIIVDRAGFEIQWGCLVFVPSIYTFHSRYTVLHPSGLSLPVAVAIFSIGLAGVGLNYWADLQRQWFRECNGKTTVWGKEPVYIKATYQVLDKSGKKSNRTSLLLASGFWGVARHFHYVFELMAAYSWCLLANPMRNGVLVMTYSTFLTCLLLHRAKRDEGKCSKKYGKDYDAYSKLVPYLVIPGIY